MPFVIGLTGNIACGKTAVGHMLLELGAECYIDADVLVHRLYQAGQPIALQVGDAFGSAMLTTDGSVDRQALGAIVFSDAEAMQRLEQIVHPAVDLALRHELATVSASGVAIVDAVKLLEGGSAALCQSKWLVLCDEEHQLARLLKRNHLERDEALVRIRAQTAAQRKIALVDEVIDNNKILQKTRDQVFAAFERFCKKFSV